MPRSEEEMERAWRTLLVDGHGSLNKMRWVFRHLPADPRCKECYSPFKGIGGAVTRFVGMRPSAKNPNFCDLCLSKLPAGGIETDIAVLFADVRSSTELGERLGPRGFAELLNRFYRTATSVLLAHDAVIDKLIGDEVMALFVPGFAGRDYRRDAVRAGQALLQAVGNGSQQGPWLPLGIGVHAGPAYVGNVGGEGILDFTALGDTVNTAARLQALATPGQLVLSDEIYADVADLYPGLPSQMCELRGKGEQFCVRVLSLGATD